MAGQEKDPHLSMETQIKPKIRRIRDTAGTTLFLMDCIRDGVGKWNIVEDLITLELKGLSSIAKMTTVSPKCSIFLSDHQVRT